MRKGTCLLPAQSNGHMGEYRMAKRLAFTLVELLTVIAIIALLAAITFPVYSRVKDSANRSADTTHMNGLRTAIQLYNVDQGGYPPALLGYVTLYTSGPSAGNVVPASALHGFLYPKRIPSLADLTPAYDKVGPLVVLNNPTSSPTTDVTFPNIDTAAGPIFDANGDGKIDTADDTAGARQAYGPADGAVCWSNVVNAIVAGTLCTQPTAEGRQFYAVSGYDAAKVPTPAGDKYELRYARFWTRNAIGTGTGCGTISGACGQGSSSDDPRQLGYNSPPEDTVVTWNSYFRDYATPGVPSHLKGDLLLTLGGSAKPVDSKTMYDFSWRQRRTK